MATEQLRQSEQDASLAANKEERLGHLKDVTNSLARVADIDMAIRDLETAHKSDAEIISSITSWEDVDAKVK